MAHRARGRRPDTRRSYTRAPPRGCPQSPAMHALEARVLLAGPAAVTLVKDINPIIYGPEILRVTSSGHTTFFTDFYNHVWATDGTEAGTRFLLNAGSNNARDLTAAGGLVYFNGDVNGRSPRQLWRTD